MILFGSLQLQYCTMWLRAEAYCCCHHSMALFPSIKSKPLLEKTSKGLDCEMTWMMATRPLNVVAIIQVKTFACLARRLLLSTAATQASSATLQVCWQCLPCLSLSLSLNREPGASAFRKELTVQLLSCQCRDSGWSAKLQGTAVRLEPQSGSYQKSWEYIQPMSRICHSGAQLEVL